MEKPTRDKRGFYIIDATVRNMDEEKIIAYQAQEKPGLIECTTATGSRWETSKRRTFTKAVVATGLCTLLLWRWGVWFAVIPLFESKQTTIIPEYVLAYAPLVWLDQQEAYFPSDMLAQVQNTHPTVNYTAVTDAPSPLTLSNLDSLNNFGGDSGKNVYLTSNVDVTTKPSWLKGVIPNTSGKTLNATSAAIIVNDHGSGNVDVFYMYFYAYNMGNTVLGQELGDHIGDWEHNMVRFVNGTPQAVWYSQHGNGQAFKYSVVEKQSIRPIAYSARGSHANYAIAGTHDHLIPDLNLPRGLLLDYTSQGTLWDPLLNAYYYTFSADTNTFSAASVPVSALADGQIDINTAPLGAMGYRGQWGDDQYLNSDSRQKEFFGFYKFVSGPAGPYDKQLNRTLVCPDNGILCIVRTVLSP